MKGFLSGEEASPKQIISLGAGSDTRFFRLKDAGLLEECVYHELDFPENTKKKVAMIHQSSKMRSLLGAEDDVAFLSDEAHAPRYHLHAIDLRQLDPNDVKYSAEPRLREIRADTATLIISECCLTYLRSDTADAVITYITTNVLVESTPKGLLLYEPINPFDAFGKVMVSNLASRGIVLQTLQQYGSLEAQISRLKKYGFGSGQGAMDLAYLQENWINEVEKERISRLEMLDEIEELDMLMKHYCITWAWSDGVNAPIWSQWRTIQSQP